MRHNEKLKVIGLTVMVIDHFYLFLFGVDPLLFCLARFIGFPFFAYGVAVGAQHTSNKQKYFQRLVLFGLAVQPVFWLATHETRLNICFTLALGALSVMLWHHGSSWARLLAFLVPLVGGTWSDPTVGYGAYGIGLILSFGIGPMASLLYQSIASAFFLLADDPQALACLSLAFVYLLPAPSFRLPRWVYYASYPGHLGVIAAIRFFT